MKQVVIDVKTSYTPEYKPPRVPEILMNHDVRRTNTKTCKTCGENKLLSEFSPSKRYALGVRSDCKICHNSYMRKKGFAKRYAEKNKEAIQAYRKKWIADNKDRYDASRRQWVRNNPKRVLAETRKYQSAKLNRTPKWLTDKHRKSMREFYENCPKGYEVDHIVPLQGKKVSGMHVPWNLQYLEMRANRRKSNTV